MTPESCDILYVITDLEVGGVPLHLHRLAGAMRSRGYRVIVVSLAPPGPVAARIERDGIGVMSCDAGGAFDVRVIPRLASRIKTARPRLVHALLFHANLAAKLAGRIARLPPDRIICEIQTVEIERRWHLWVDALTHDLSYATVGNSPSVIEHLARAAYVPRTHLRLVRGGIDIDAIRQARPLDRSTLGLRNEQRVILWVGRLDPIKGVNDLIDAFATLVSPTTAGTTPPPLSHTGSAPATSQWPRPAQSHTTKPLDAVLLLVGDGAERTNLEAQAARHGFLADGRVRFLGSRDDVPSLLKSADVFAFPSRTEGLPNALLEAMAAKLPVVTTDAPGCRDLVTNADTGLIVPVNNPPALSAALRRLLTDATLASRLGQAAGAEVARHWRRQDMLDAYEALYREILDRTISPPARHS